MVLRYSSVEIVNSSLSLSHALDIKTRSCMFFYKNTKKYIHTHSNIRCVVCFLDGHNPRDLSYPIGHRYQRKTCVEQPTSDTYIICFSNAST